MYLHETPRTFGIFDLPAFVFELQAFKKSKIKSDTLYSHDDPVKSFGKDELNLHLLVLSPLLDINCKLILLLTPHLTCYTFLTELLLKNARF